MEFKLPKLSMPTRQMAQKEAAKTEGTIMLYGVALAALLLVQFVLPDEAENKS